MADTSRSAENTERSRLTACEQRIGYRFGDRNYLIAALTHASGAEHRLASNERLEFLGDAILGKQGPLTDYEWEMMKQHPIVGADLLAGSTSRLLERAREVAPSPCA